jgi:hypothetical protein
VFDPSRECRRMWPPDRGKRSSDEPTTLTVQGGGGSGRVSLSGAVLRSQGRDPGRNLTPRA